MRHGFLLNSIFWGVVLILFGIALLLGNVFGIHIHIFQFFLAVLFFYIGIRILVGWRRWGGRRRAGRFEDRRIGSVRPEDRHEILFGRGDIDLTGFILQDQTIRVEVNTAFGGCIITIDAKMPMKIRASSAFAGIRLPDGHGLAFGEHIWKSSNLDEAKPYLLLDVSSVFGGVHISAR